ncbi:MAG: hypothetical protein KJ767_03475 [Nanoarchaeota archaeon]|nr:hypothetical protein [Nanoarchaeota archaeon]
MYKNRNPKLLRYKNELTKELLKKEYFQNKSSISQLQKKFKKDWNTIRYYLHFYNIPLRSHKEQATISSLGGKYKYTKLLTKQYLLKEYIKNKKGIKDISKELKIDRGTVKRYLKKYKIKIRNSKYQINLKYPPKEFNLNKETISFIDGLLLGDASIPKRKDNILPRSLSQACKHKEYLVYILTRLSHMNILSSPIHSRWIKDERCKNKGYNQHFLQTRRYKTFELFRDKWYKRGKKGIPKEIIINRDLLLQCYLCDGNFYREIKLCLDAFNKKDIYFLKNLIEKELNIQIRICKVNYRYELAIKKSDANKFLNYIGPSPIKCYEYKWKDNESEEAKERKRLNARLHYHKNKNDAK